MLLTVLRDGASVSRRNLEAGNGCCPERGRRSERGAASCNPTRSGPAGREGGPRNGKSQSMAMGDDWTCMRFVLGVALLHGHGGLSSELDSLQRA